MGKLNTGRVSNFPSAAGPVSSLASVQIQAVQHQSLGTEPTWLSAGGTDLYSDVGEGRKGMAGAE